MRTFAEAAKGFVLRNILGYEDSTGPQDYDFLELGKKAIFSERYAWPKED